MASDPKLVGRLSSILSRRPGIEQRKMFGGVAYLLNGNICVGVHKDSLVVRAGEREAAPLLARAHVRPMDITGKPMKGWIMVEPDGLKRKADLLRYVDIALRFVEGLTRSEDPSEGRSYLRRAALMNQSGSRELRACASATAANSIAWMRSKGRTCRSPWGMSPKLAITCRREPAA